MQREIDRVAPAAVMGAAHGPLPRPGWILAVKFELVIGNEMTGCHGEDIGRHYYGAETDHTKHNQYRIHLSSSPTSR